MNKILGIALLLIGLSGAALANGIAPAPEINPASALSALTLLSGGLLIIRGRKRN